MQDLAARLVKAGYELDTDFVVTDRMDGNGPVLSYWREGLAPPTLPLPEYKWVPRYVSRAQARVQLFDAGLLPAVEAAVAAHPYEVVRIWYADAAEWQRDNAYLAALALELGLTDEQVDDMFIAASARGF